MQAIIQTGGKQYLVSTGDKIKVEKLDAEEGKKVTFSNVLFIGDEKSVKIGTPKITGAKVEAKVFKQGRAKKQMGIKHNAKKRYKMKFGHRQSFTEVEISKITEK